MTQEIWSYHIASYQDHTKRTQEPPKDAPLTKAGTILTVIRTVTAIRGNPGAETPAFITLPKRTHTAPCVVTPDGKLVTRREPESVLSFPAGQHHQVSRQGRGGSAVLSRSLLTGKSKRLTEGRATLLGPGGGTLTAARSQRPAA